MRDRRAYRSDRTARSMLAASLARVRAWAGVRDQAGHDAAANRHARRGDLRRGLSRSERLALRRSVAGATVSRRTRPNSRRRRREREWARLAALREIRERLALTRVALDSFAAACGRSPRSRIPVGEVGLNAEIPQSNRDQEDGE
jgi:hypothetical protein